MWVYCSTNHWTVGGALCFPVVFVSVSIFSFLSVCTSLHRCVYVHTYRSSYYQGCPRLMCRTGVGTLSTPVDMTLRSQSSRWAPLLPHKNQILEHKTWVNQRHLHIFIEFFVKNSQKKCKTIKNNFWNSWKTLSLCLWLHFKPSVSLHLLWFPLTLKFYSTIREADMEFTHRFYLSRSA